MNALSQSWRQAWTRLLRGRTSRRAIDAQAGRLIEAVGRSAAFEQATAAAMAAEPGSEAHGLAWSLRHAVRRRLRLGADTATRMAARGRL